MFGPAVLSAVLLMATSSHATSPDCQCAGKDPVGPADPKAAAECAKFEPQKIQKDCFRPESGLCTFPPVTKPFAQLMSEASSMQLTPAKSFERALDYFSCYRNATQFSIKHPDQQYCHFKKTLAPYIKLAAESAKLDPTVFACLIKRESDFDPEAKSNFYVEEIVYETVTENGKRRKRPVMENGKVKKKRVLKHAYSYGQITEDALDTLKYVVGRPMEHHRRRLEEAKKELASLQVKYTKTKNAEAARQIKSMMKARAAYVGSLTNNLKTRAVWDKYWEDSPNIPTTLDLKSLYCPKIAFALSAASQTSNLYTMFSEQELIETDFGIRAKTLRVTAKSASGKPIYTDEYVLQQEYDTALYLTGAYNQGPGGFESGCDPEEGVQACLDQIKSKNPALPMETIRHLHSIHNCARGGSEEPMLGTGKKDCKESKCSS